MLIHFRERKASGSFVIFLDFCFNTLGCKPANSIKLLYSNLVICFPCLINCTIVLISNLKINLFFLTCKIYKIIPSSFLIYFLCNLAFVGINIWISLLQLFVWIFMNIQSMSFLVQMLWTDSLPQSEFVRYTHYGLYINRCLQQIEFSS